MGATREELLCCLKLLSESAHLGERIITLRKALFEQTQGNDIACLMGAIASQKWLWKQMRIPLLIKSIKLVGTAVSVLT